MEEIPTQQIQDIVEQYCLYRPLTRPKTNIKTAVLSCIIFVSVSFIITFLLSRLSDWQGISSFLPQTVRCFKEKHPYIGIVILWIIVCLVMVILSLRFILIGLVHLYQHYAAEEIRRRCLLKPTCSEYMILAIQKYGPFIGGLKGVHRLLFTCQGNIYRIDYPYKKGAAASRIKKS